MGDDPIKTKFGLNIVLGGQAVKAFVFACGIAKLRGRNC